MNTNKLPKTCDRKFKKENYKYMLKLNKLEAYFLFNVTLDQHFLSYALLCRLFSIIFQLYAHASFVQHKNLLNFGIFPPDGARPNQILLADDDEL